MKLFFVIAILLVGCTDSTRASFGALDEPAHVVCYSGGVKVYEGDSTGVVSSSSYGDGRYNCYICKNDAGEIVEAKIVFIEDYEEEEEDDYYDDDEDLDEEA